MAVNIINNKANGTVVVHATSTGSVICTGNDSVSNLASTGENVVAAHIRQIWASSLSGAAGNYWELTRGNSSVNTVVAVLDSTAWFDFAGNGQALKLAEDGDNLYLTLTGSAGMCMVELKKEIGP